MAERTPFQARPTTYKGIRMRSRTEAAYAARLDASGIAWEYEPQCFADETGQYLPDFKITDRSAVAYTEVKGALRPDEVAGVQRRMEIIWSSEPAAMLILVVIGSGESYHASERGKWKHWMTAAPVSRAAARVSLGAVRSAAGDRLALGAVRRASTPVVDEA